VQVAVGDVLAEAPPLERLEPVVDRTGTRRPPVV